MKALIFTAAVIGYTLNIIAILYGLHDAFNQSFNLLTEYIHLVGVLCVRVVGLRIFPIGVVLGYF